jgi:hypothetical protein
MTMNNARRKLTVRPISVKSIESSDNGVSPILFSYFLPALKFLPSIDENIVYVWGFIIILFVIVLINKKSISHNPMLLALGYRHYKITTEAGMSLMALSKSKIIDKTQITRYIQLTDYLILNAP